MKIIFKSVVGSHAYGTNIEGSDRDIKGVYIQDPKDVYLNGYKEQFEVSKDEVYFELTRFLSLCKTNNPTMLELLYSPEDCIIEKDPLFDVVLKNRDKFLSKSCRFSFGGYAVDQIKKANGLDKKMNWENSRKERKNVLDFCWVYPTKASARLTENYMHYDSSAVPLRKFLDANSYYEARCGLVKVEHVRDCYLLFYDHVGANVVKSETERGRMKDMDFKGIAGEDSNEVRLSTVPEYMASEGILYFNKDAYQIHCKEYGEYTKWLQERNTQRYIDVEGHGQKIDGKNLLHCVRLLQTALEIPEKKTIQVRRPNAEYLIEIRRGKHDLKSIILACEKDIEKLDEVYSKSDLPDTCDEQWMRALNKTIKDEYFETTT